MAKIKGIIEGINQKDKTYGLLINENWYNIFGKCSFQKGEEVEFDCVEKATPDGKIFKNGKNIIKLGVTMKQETSQSEIITDKNLAGMRFGNCLNATGHYSKDCLDNANKAIELFNMLIDAGIYSGSMKLNQKVIEDGKKKEN